MTAAYVIMALCVIVGVPFTLWWWREADKWADKEHQRFTHKPDESLKDAVVVKWDKADVSATEPAAPAANVSTTTPVTDHLPPG